MVGPVVGPVVGSAGPVAVLVPAKDEAERIAATVAAVLTVPGVGAVVVVDDGSTDATAEAAARAGALVVRHARNRGKAAALETGFDALAGAPGGPPAALLLVDADLAGTAAATAPLLGPVLAGEADMTIALLPPQTTAGGAPAGGRGLVVGLARRGVAAATGWTPTQPLSGMRALTPAAFAAARPLARGWGVETGLTIDLLRSGHRVLEVPCALAHRATGSDWRAQLHRARQGRDVARALLARRVSPWRR